MSVISTIRAGRVAAESLMTDSGVVMRITGQTLNESTGQYEDTTTTIYTGKLRVQTYEPFEQTPDAAGRTYTVQRYRVSIPVGAGTVRVGDVVTIGAAALDPDLVGRTYRVAGLLHKSQATSQRLLVDEIVSNPSGN